MFKRYTQLILNKIAETRRRVADETTSPGVELFDHVHDAFGEAAYGRKRCCIGYTIAPSRMNDVRGSPLDDRGLARRLKEFGSRSRDVRIGSEVGDTTPNTSLMFGGGVSI